MTSDPQHAVVAHADEHDGKGGRLRLEPLADIEGSAAQLVYEGDNVMMGYAETPADLAGDSRNRGMPQKIRRSVAGNRRVRQQLRKKTRGGLFGTRDAVGEKNQRSDSARKQSRLQSGGDFESDLPIRLQ